MKDLYLGERGTLVQYVQLALTRAGYRTRIDGIFGELTCASLRDFFKENMGECSVTQEAWNRLIPYLKGYTTHRVGEGDTYLSIAEKYGTEIQQLLVANPKTDFTNLLQGMTIQVPFGFDLVPRNVNYSSILNEYIIEGMTVRYPFLVKEEIGTSVMGRPLTCLKFGNGQREVFYNAAFHANEWITTPLLLRFAEEYAQAYATNRSLYQVPAWQLFDNFTLYLLPMVNPDGVDLVNGIIDSGAYYVQARKIAADYPAIPFPSGWKANIDGIDLNLQFPAGWEQAKAVKYANGYTSPAPRDYVGERPLQAPESIAVYEFTRAHDLNLILAYHTQGEVIYWKYLAYNPKDAYRIARYFGSVSGYEVEETPSESGNAGYKDWFIQTYNLPGYTIEVGRGVNPLPISQLEQIYQDNYLILEGGMTQLVDS